MPHEHVDLRLIEVITPSDRDVDVIAALNSREGIDCYGDWKSPLAGDRTRHTYLVAAEDTEAFIDLMEDLFEDEMVFRVLLMPVEATLPSVRREVPRPPEENNAEHGLRISRHELYQDVIAAMRPWPVFIAMVLLAAVLVALGLATNDVIVTIGAMVMSPLLGTLVALSLSTTLGDSYLGRRATRQGAVGAALGLSAAVVIALIFDIDTTLPMIIDNTNVDLTSIAVALAAGIGAALAFTTGLPQALIGVTVAVALLPPLVTAGLNLGEGLWEPAARAFLLFIANAICINLAGVLTFTLQGIRPHEWYEARRARRSAQRAIIAEVGLLAVLVTLIIVLGSRW